MSSDHRALALICGVAKVRRLPRNALAPHQLTRA
jgi:hypothetical protein